MQVSVGCGQITWRGSGASEEQVLAEIRRAGYEGAPWSSRDGRGAPAIAEQLGRCGLKPAPGYLGGEFWDEDRREHHLAEARRYAEISRELGLSEVYLSAGGFERVMASGRTRRQAAAHVTAEDRLPDDELRRLAEGVEAIARTTLEQGVRACYHNHVGSVVETEEEIERLLSLVDPEVLFLGPDTGHLEWAGVDAAAFCARHAGRIKTMHVKDIDPKVREEGTKADWDYRTFSDHGIFTELGEGCLDLKGVLGALGGAGFNGWLVVETDVTQRPTAMGSAVISRAALWQAGV